MTPELEKVRDVLADEADERWQKENYDGGYDTLSFKQGFDSAIAHLEKQAGSFDKQLAIDQAKHEDSDGYFGFLTGAEWQFDQCKARIGLAEQELKHTINTLELESDVNKMLEARIKEYSKLIRDKGIR